MQIESVHHHQTLRYIPKGYRMSRKQKKSKGRITVRAIFHDPHDLCLHRRLRSQAPSRQEQRTIILTSRRDHGSLRLQRRMQRRDLGLLMAYLLNQALRHQYMGVQVAPIQPRRIESHLAKEVIFHVQIRAQTRAMRAQKHLTRQTNILQCTIRILALLFESPKHHPEQPNLHHLTLPKSMIRIRAHSFLVRRPIGIALERQMLHRSQRL